MDNTDHLQFIFNWQKKHNSLWQDEEKFNDDKNYRLAVIKDFVLGISRQNTSLLDSINWSKHMIDRIEDTHNTKIQLIDIAKYTIGLFMLLGGDALEFASMFASRSREMDSRWAQMFENLTEKTNVVIFDIDGVIADYETKYTNYLESECGLKKVQSDRSSYSFYQTYGITRQAEEELNIAFVQQGGFADLPVYDGIVDVMNSIRKMGCKIVLLTARPSWHFKRIVIDTRNWLSNNNIPHDFLFWSKDKADVIINNIMPANILCMVEDRDKHSIEVSHIGIDVLLIDRSYNQSIANSNKIKRIYSYKEILPFIKKQKRNKV